MKLTVERLPESQVRLDIAADETEFADAMERAIRKVSREIQVPGFRKGKVPRNMVERMFGREVFLEEAHKSIMDDLYRKALKQEELVPVGEPEVEVTAPDPIEFSVTTSIYPSIEPGDYASVRVDPIDAAIEESAVDEILERLRVRSSPWVDPAEARLPNEGDQVTLDLAMTTEEGEPFQDPIEDAVFVLGESQLFDSLREAIEELNVGDATDVTIAFDENDEAATERLRGKAVTYHVTLKGVKERELLSLDDEFAKTYAEEESLDALREAVRNDLHQAKSNEARSEVVSTIIDRIAEGSTVDVPAPMVDDAVEDELNRIRTRLQYQRTTLESYLRGNDQTEDELRVEVRPSVAQRLRNSLILREISEREAIEVADEDLESEIAEITSAAPDPEQAQKIYSADRYMRTVLRNDLFDRRLTDRLVEIATEGRGAVMNAFVPPPPKAPAIEAEFSAGGTGDVAEASSTDAAPSSVAGTGSANCPDGYPIKGNESSMLYHAPGGQSYDQTIPEVCFATEADALVAGYRATRTSADQEGEAAEGADAS